MPVWEERYYVYECDGCGSQTKLPTSEIDEDQLPYGWTKYQHSQYGRFMYCTKRSCKLEEMSLKESDRELCEVE